MPTPVAHCIFGLIISSTSSYGKIFKNKFLNFFLIIFVTVAPDFDFIPGIFAGFLFKYHHGISHSFFFGIVFSFLLSFIIYLFQKRYLFSRTFLFAVIYSFHVILDLFVYDDGKLNGLGMPVFFPFNSDRYISSVVLFHGELFDKGKLTVESFFRYSNFILLVTEVFSGLLFGILLITALYFLKNKNFLKTNKYK